MEKSETLKCGCKIIARLTNFPVMYSQGIWADWCVRIGEGGGCKHIEKSDNGIIAAKLSNAVHVQDVAATWHLMHLLTIFSETRKKDIYEIK